MSLKDGPCFVDFKGNKSHIITLSHPFDNVANVGSDDQVSLFAMLGDTLISKSVKSAKLLSRYGFSEDNFAQLARQRNMKSLNVKVVLEGSFDSSVSLFALVWSSKSFQQGDMSNITKFVHQCSDVDNTVNSNTYILTLCNVRAGMVFDVGYISPSAESSIPESSNSNYAFRNNLSNNILSASPYYTSLPSSQPTAIAVSATPAVVSRLTMSFCEQDVDVEVTDKTPAMLYCSLAYNSLAYRRRQLQSFRRFHRNIESFISNTYGSRCGRAYMQRVQGEACEDCVVRASEARLRHLERETQKARDAESSKLAAISSLDALNVDLKVVPVNEETQKEVVCDEMSRKNKPSDAAELQYDLQYDVVVPQVLGASLTLDSASQIHLDASLLLQPESGMGVAGDASMAFNDSWVDGEECAATGVVIAENADTADKDNVGTENHEQSSRIAAELNTPLPTTTVPPPLEDFLRSHPFYCLKAECAGDLLDCDYRSPAYLDPLTAGLVGLHAGKEIFEPSSAAFHRQRWTERDKLLEKKIHLNELHYNEQYYNTVTPDKHHCPECHRLEPYLDARYREMCVAQGSAIKYVAKCVKCHLPYRPQHTFLLSRWEQRMGQLETARLNKFDSLRQTVASRQVLYRTYKFKDSMRKSSTTATLQSGSRKLRPFSDFSLLDWRRILMLVGSDEDTRETTAANTARNASSHRLTSPVPPGPEDSKGFTVSVMQSSDVNDSSDDEASPGDDHAEHFVRAPLLNSNSFEVGGSLVAHELTEIVKGRMSQREFLGASNPVLLQCSVEDLPAVPKVVRNLRHLKEVSQEFGDGVEDPATEPARTVDIITTECIADNTSSMTEAPPTIDVMYIELQNIDEPVIDMRLNESSSSTDAPVTLDMTAMSLKEEAYTEGTACFPQQTTEDVLGSEIEERPQELPEEALPFQTSSYFWVSGFAGVIPAAAIATGTVVDNTIDNSTEYCSDSEDYFTNSFDSYTVRVRCIFDSDSHVLEEYDLARAYEYGANKERYVERYYLGVCRAGSLERAIYTVPGDVTLHERMHVLSVQHENVESSGESKLGPIAATDEQEGDDGCSDGEEKDNAADIPGDIAEMVAAAARPFLGSASDSQLQTIDSAALGTVDTNFSRKARSRSSVSFFVSPPSDSAVEVKPDIFYFEKETVDPYSVIATNRCEYLVRVLSETVCPEAKTNYNARNGTDATSIDQSSAIGNDETVSHLSTAEGGSHLSPRMPTDTAGNTASFCSFDDSQVLEEATTVDHGTAANDPVRHSHDSLLDLHTTASAVVEHQDCQGGGEELYGERVVISDDDPESTAVNDARGHHSGLQDEKLENQDISSFDVGDARRSLVSYNTLRSAAANKFPISEAAFRDTVLDRHYRDTASPALALANSTFCFSGNATLSVSRLLNTTVAQEPDGSGSEKHARSDCVEAGEETIIPQATSVRRKYRWEGACGHWRGEDNELFLPHNTVHVANLLPPGGGRKSFDANIDHLSHFVARSSKNKKAAATSSSTEYVFVVRCLLHNVNIVSGSFVFVKKPVVTVNRGLLSRLSFMLSNMPSPSAMASLAEIHEGGDKYKVDVFESSVQRDYSCVAPTGDGAATTSSSAALYGDIRHCSPVSTLVAAAPLKPKDTHDRGSSSSQKAEEPQQVSEVLGALREDLIAVFVFNGRVYLRPLKDIEFLCIDAE